MRHAGESWTVPKPLVAVAGGLGAFLAIVALALTAFDVLLVLLLCGLVLLFERTIGDWFADRLGDGAGKVLLVLLVATLGWGLLGTSQGQAALRDLIQAAGESGLGMAFVSSDRLGPVRVSPHVPGAANATVNPPLLSPPSTGGAPSGDSTASTNNRPAASASGNTAGAPEIAKSGPTDLRLGEESLRGGSTPQAVNTQLTVHAVYSARTREMLVRTVVTAGANAATGGSVEFRVNDRVIAKVSLGPRGVAELRVRNITPGDCLVTARYSGSSGLRGTSSATVCSEKE